MFSDSVQGVWNEFENKLINIVDEIVPIKEFENNLQLKSQVPPQIKHIINKRKRLLHKLKVDKSRELKESIVVLDKKIRLYFHQSKKKKVRQSIVAGNTSSLWRAVKIANDVNISSLPGVMFRANEEIKSDKLAETFASYFDKKVKDIVDSVSIDESVFNGNKRINAENNFFMNKNDVYECLKSLKCKNSEGFDRIPQRILLDGAEILIDPLTSIFEKIYQQKTIPDQWLVAKTLPVFKNKGDKKDIESYRPIANLCSVSKVFEKLILKRILSLQDENNCDLTGTNQHGFKKNKSTSTLSIELQSLIARALDEDNFVLVASLDLSAAFDIVNVNLLLKRLGIIGLPEDMISLIKVWLKGRSYYVSIDGSNSAIYDLLLGTVQGSILGPILYALFVSPILDLERLFAFADDNFVPVINNNINVVANDTEKTLERITKWLRQSGLKVNDSKTELCLFYKNDMAPVTIKVGNNEIKSSKSINVLGVIFDSRMTWSEHIAKTTMKANKALNTVKLIRRYFETKEILNLLTSNYYSILYYNCEVWLLHSLNSINKSKLMSASATALKVAFNYQFPMTSFVDLHVKAKRATPSQFTNYKLALMLHKLYNSDVHSNEWLHLNFNQIITSRQTSFRINKNNNLNIGMNALSNRLLYLNGKIPFLWLNKSLNSYKIECKKKFL
jgi:hypothetical protein